MPIINNLSEISDVYIGSENIENIYLGEDLLWTAASDPLYTYFEAKDPLQSNVKLIVYVSVSNINIIKCYHTSNSLSEASTSSQLNYTITQGNNFPSTSSDDFPSYRVTNITNTVDSLSMELYERDMRMNFLVNFTANSLKDLYK